jgi:CRP/FNR family transcriptional regulator, cyclic AMP receptor protein
MEHTPKEKEQVRILSGVDFLESLPEEELAKLIKRNHESHFRPKEIFSTPYEEDDRIFVIKKGRVRIYKIGPEGREQTLGELGDRTVFAAHQLHGSYGQALEPATILALSEEELKRVFESNPEVALRLIRVLTRRLRLADERLADVALKEVPARVASLILQLVEEEGLVTGKAHKIPTRYTHERLGTMIGAKRVAVSRAIRQLKESASVELHDRYIHVRDMEALRRFATAGRGE